MRAWPIRFNAGGPDGLLDGKAPGKPSILNDQARRPSAPKDQRTKSAYIFGAICPEQSKGAGLVLPFCNTGTMSLHLTEIALAVVPGAHALVLMA